MRTIKRGIPKKLALWGIPKLWLALAWLAWLVGFGLAWPGPLGPMGQGPGPGWLGLAWLGWLAVVWFGLGPMGPGPVGPWARALGPSGPMGPYGTFQIHLSSQNVYVNDLGMTGPIFCVPGQD